MIVQFSTKSGTALARLDISAGSLRLNLEPPVDCQSNGNTTWIPGERVGGVSGACEAAVEVGLQ
jgi:hypothetical protein